MAPAAGALQVDESALGTDATVSFAGSFGGTPHYGADGAGSVSSVYALGVKSAGVDSGLVDTATGNHIYLYLEGGEVVGRVGSATTTPDAGGAVALRVSNSGALVTLDQVRAIVHPDASNPDDAKSLGSDDLITLTRSDTVTDKDGDSNTGSATINLGGAISIHDDGPSLTALLLNNAGAVVTDETSQLGVTVTGAASIYTGGVVTLGADAGTSGLVLRIDNADTGLQTTVGGHAISLVADTADSHVVYGRYDSDGNGTLDTTAFTVSISNAGVLSVKQDVALRHPDTTNKDDAVTLTGKLSVVVSAVDGDLDRASQSLSIGGSISFKDDGPKEYIENSASMPSVNLDETLGPDRYATPESSTSHPGNTDDSPGVLGRVTTSIAGGILNLFTYSGSYGSDGPGSITYTASFTGISPSGLQTNLSSTEGGAIKIFLDDSGAIVGRDASNADVFKIEIVNTASSGDPVHQLQTTLYKAISHPDTSSHDESTSLLALASGKVYLHYQIVRTDGDGDEAPVSADLKLIDAGSSFLSFDDDAPQVNTFAIGQEGYLWNANGNPFGSDGGRSVEITVEGSTYTWNVGADTLSGLGPSDSFDAATHLLQVTLTSGDTFSVDMDDGRYTVDLLTASDLSLDVGYKLVDKDGDSASGTLHYVKLLSTTGTAEPGLSGFSLTGTTGNDVLIGGANDDKLDGADGNDLLCGGKGSDIMTGGPGADTFYWRSTDYMGGTYTDTIKDFGDGQDKLNLRDLLQGEHAGTSGSLEQYLHFSTTVNPGGRTDTVIDVTVNGGNAGGTNPSDMTIVLEGVTLVGADDAAKIAALLASNRLLVDH